MGYIYRLGFDGYATGVSEGQWLLCGAGCVRVVAIVNASQFNITGVFRIKLVFKRPKNAGSKP